MATVTERWRVIMVDAERQRVLIAIRRPGAKVCARIRWVKSRLVLLSAMLEHNTLDFGHRPLKTP